MARSKAPREIKTDRYYDAESEAMKTVEYVQKHSMAGYVSGPEYRVSYQRTDGSWLNGTRHKDRGSLMTDVRISHRPWCR